uniref:Uncharacterized protein n=1 Tax=Cyanistes caeruleus TaxID=156563 RepID=A0A8C0UX09_CYACU
AVSQSLGSNDDLQEESALVLFSVVPSGQFRCSPLHWHCTCGHKVNWISLLFQLKPNRFGPLPWI